MSNITVRPSLVENTEGLVNPTTEPTAFQMWKSQVRGRSTNAALLGGVVGVGVGLLTDYTVIKSTLVGALASGALAYFSEDYRSAVARFSRRYLSIQY